MAGISDDRPSANAIAALLICGPASLPGATGEGVRGCAVTAAMRISVVQTLSCPVSTLPMPCQFPVHSSVVSSLPSRGSLVTPHTRPSAAQISTKLPKIQWQMPQIGHSNLAAHYDLFICLALLAIPELIRKKLPCYEKSPRIDSVGVAKRGFLFLISLSLVYASKSHQGSGCTGVLIFAFGTPSRCSAPSPSNQLPDHPDPPCSPSLLNTL